MGVELEQLRCGPYVALLPYFEQTALYNQVAAGGNGYLLVVVNPGAGTPCGTPHCRHRIVHQTPTGAK